jgi:putative Mn2+ efflux pump MntP
MIGCATFMMATIGIMAGHYMGHRVGKIAEMLGGIGLIAVGFKILIQHLSGLT